MRRLVLRGSRGMTVASPGISSGGAAAESQANTVSHNYFRLNAGSQTRPSRFGDLATLNLSESTPQASLA